MNVADKSPPYYKDKDVSKAIFLNENIPFQEDIGYI